MNTPVCQACKYYVHLKQVIPQDIKTDIMINSNPFNKKHCTLTIALAIREISKYYFMTLRMNPNDSLVINETDNEFLFSKEIRLFTKLLLCNYRVKNDLSHNPTTLSPTYLQELFKKYKFFQYSITNIKRKKRIQIQKYLNSFRADLWKQHHAYLYVYRTEVLEKLLVLLYYIEDTERFFITNKFNESRYWPKEYVTLF